MSNFKYLILPTLLLSQTAFAINSKFKCDHLLFSGLDIQHKNSVQVCLSNGNVSYTYGKINSPRNELDMLVNRKNAAWDYYADGRGQNVVFGTIAVRSGNYTYKMTSGKDQRGLLKAFITVYKGDNTLVTIPLDPKTVVNQISPLLKNHGIPSFKDKQYEYKKRTLADSFYFS